MSVIANKPEESRRGRKGLAAIVGLGVVGAGVIAGAGFGGTNALFTASQDRPNNVFSTGTIGLDVNRGADDADTAINVTNIAPGDVNYLPITVKNTGSLALRYDVTSTPTALSTAVAGTSGVTGNVADGTQFAKDLAVSVKKVANSAACTATGFADVAATAVTAQSTFGGATPATGTATKFIGDAAATTAAADVNGRQLAANTAETLCLQVTLPTSATNADQGASATFDLLFNAVQTKNA